MSYACPRCGTTLVETDDDVNDYELEGAQVRHTVKRCEESKLSTGDETMCPPDAGSYPTAR
jgi:hypothetical protein